MFGVAKAGENQKKVESIQKKIIWNEIIYNMQVNKRKKIQSDFCPSVNEHITRWMLNVINKVFLQFHYFPTFFSIFWQKKFNAS